MHLEVSSLLRRPFSSRICRARRYPNPSRLDVDEDEEVKIDHSFDRPLPLRREVALPHRGGMAFQEVRPSVGMVARIGTEPSFNQNVLDGLARDSVAKPPHRLDDLGVAPASLFADPDDRVGNALVGPWPAALAFASDFGRFAGPSSIVRTQRRKVE